MTPFMERFRDTGVRETRTLIVAGHATLPDGQFAFMDLYCNERGCDCRRVIINVIRPETGLARAWATIGYGWESLDFYRRWGSSGNDPVEMKGPYLDLLNTQTEFSPALLQLFQTLLDSPDYVERLKRHYAMFRESVDREHGARMARESQRVENRRKRLRDPRRR